MWKWVLVNVVPWTPICHEARFDSNHLYSDDSYANNNTSQSVVIAVRTSDVLFVISLATVAVSLLIFHCLDGFTFPYACYVTDIFRLEFFILHNLSVTSIIYYYILKYYCYNIVWIVSHIILTSTIVAKRNKPRSAGINKHSLCM